MSNSLQKLSAAALAAMFATSLVAVDLAEAGGNKRTRNRDGMMRLGGPANGNGNGSTNGAGGASGIVDRTGGPSFLSQDNVRAFSLRNGNDRNGPEG